MKEKREKLTGAPDVSREQIMEYFETLDRRITGEREKAKAIAKQNEVIVDKPNPLHRYTEPLSLNRKNHTSEFKAITRNKRNNLMDINS